jgi:hypothetical protein
MGGIYSTGTAYGYYGGEDKWPAEIQCDVVFSHPTKGNPWNEAVGSVFCRQWTGANIYLFKILNDSIKEGLKPATDPNDFELIETFGGDNASWTLGGKTIDMITSCVRKPEYFQPKPGVTESFGTTPDNSEWLLYDRPYFDAISTPWPLDVLAVTQDLGSHFMDDVTIYRSTVGSLVYKVSEGYSFNEQIRGLTTGTTATGFLANIIKANEDQTLILKNGSDGNILIGNNPVSNGDTLIVVSADFMYSTKYILEVTDEGLSDDALLTSDVYTVEVDETTGTISGFDYGVAVKNVLVNVNVPVGATLTVVDADDAWVPMLRLNFDTIYVDVSVNDQIFFEVIAEDGITKILYQLKPNATASDAFVTSDVFMIQQEGELIYLIPLGTTVQAFLKNLVPAPGATMKLVDKLGHERTSGIVAKDDQLVVTSEDETVVRTYDLSLLPAYIGEVINYYPYVVSEVYIVDQFTLNISDGIYSTTEIATFLANLEPSVGATLMVVDASDVENTGSTINSGDKLKVTAADGVTTVYYSIELWATSVDDLSSNPIQIYPNPSSGMLNIAGLELGNRIQVYNILGASVRDMVAHQNHETLSLENQPAGVYFIIVSNDDSIIGRYKLILK